MKLINNFNHRCCIIISMAAFSMMGLGVLLIWPRFIVLVMFVTMLFMYYLLAKKEEEECQKKFGQSFTTYTEKTSLFIPGDSFVLKKLPSFPASGFKRIVAFLLLFVSVMGLSVIAAFGIRNYSIASLSTSYSRDTATISTAPKSFICIQDRFSLSAAFEPTNLV